MIESGDEVVVTYETTTSTGGRGSNTEVVTFDDEDKITRVEVYFGWNLVSAPAAPPGLAERGRDQREMCGPLSRRPAASCR